MTLLFTLSLALLACVLSLAVTALSLVLARLFRRSPSASDRGVGAVLIAAGLSWTGVPALLALWSYPQNGTALVILLITWGTASALLLWGLLRSIDVAARP